MTLLWALQTALLQAPTYLFTLVRCLNVIVGSLLLGRGLTPTSRPVPPLVVPIRQRIKAPADPQLRLATPQFYTLPTAL